MAPFTSLRVTYTDDPLTTDIPPRIPSLRSLPSR